MSKIPAIGTYIQQLHVMGSPVFISLQIHIRQISWAATAVATLVAHVVTPVADLRLTVLSFKIVLDKLML